MLAERLGVKNSSVCFSNAIQLLCQHPLLPSGMFSSTRPSWKEDGTVISLDGSMFRSVKRINETHAVLELVPERSHFEPSGAHHYTCFLPLNEGGIIESDPILVIPQGMEGTAHCTCTSTVDFSTVVRYSTE